MKVKYLLRRRRLDMRRPTTLRFLLAVQCLVLLVHFLRVASGTQYTYAGRPGSFARYERWNTGQDGLANFSFKTSQADALLFYLDSSGNGGNFLVVWLEEGRMNARIDVGSAGPLDARFGRHLNDLASHTLLIKHTQSRFEFHLDGNMAGEVRYDLGHIFQTRSSVYIGGLPTSYEPDYGPAASLEPLAGCVDNVKFADGSPNMIQLRSRDPQETNELEEGCVDGCENAQCNGGRCVQNWSRLGGYFCDCSYAQNVGNFCTVPSSRYQLTLSGEGYQCYNVTPEPFTPDHDNFTVQLQSPLPASGTIITGDYKNQTDSFNLFLEDQTLHYELTIEGKTFSRNSTLRLSQSQNYRISISRSTSRVIITIQTVSSTNQIADAETIEMNLPSGTPMPAFQLVCVGGVTLETQLYSGVMERIIVNHIAVLETQTPTLFTPSDFISVRGNPSSPSLTFHRRGFHSDEFSFQFRLWTGQAAGILLQAGSTPSFMLMVIIFNDTAGDIMIAAPQAGIFTMCENVHVVDNQWHLLEVKKTERAGNRGITMTFDRDAATSCHVNISNEHFDVLEGSSSTLQLGVTTGTGSAPFSGNENPFQGCFQKIQFKTGSNTFRPNLEVPITQYERFRSDGCRDCDPEYESQFCKRKNGICWNSGFRNITCECKEPYVGQTCQCLGPSICSEPQPTNLPPGTSSPTSSSSSSSPPTTPTNGTTPLTTPTEPSVKVNKGNNNGDTVDYDALGQWVGIATAIILILIVLMIMMVFIGCFVHSQRIKRVGFYRTHENTPSVSLPHFSASLKTAHSHTLNLEQNRVTAITNGRTVHPTYASGEKEFYI